MKVDYKNNTVIIKDTEPHFETFISKLEKEFHTFEKHNVIVNLTHDATVITSYLNLFVPIATTQQKNKKSLVIVASNIDYNHTPQELLVVPTLQEAHDIIEMEEIERDLGF